MNRTVTCNSNTYISNLGELTKQISKVLSRFDKMVSAWFLAGPDSRSVYNEWNILVKLVEACRPPQNI